MDKKEIVINQLAMRVAQLETDKAFLISEIEILKGELKNEHSKHSNKSESVKTE